MSTCECNKVLGVTTVEDYIRTANLKKKLASMFSGSTPDVVTVRLKKIVIDWG